MRGSAADGHIDGEHFQAADPGMPEQWAGVRADLAFFLDDPRGFAKEHGLLGPYRKEDK
jgi:hypothetical protein